MVHHLDLTLVGKVLRYSPLRLLYVLPVFVVLLLASLAVFVAFLPVVIRLIDRGTTTTIAIVADDLELADRSATVMGGFLNLADGGSGGKKSLSGSVEDSAAALRLARGRAGGSRERLIVLGQSLGGALALAALDRDGGEGVRGVILDSTFASYRETARLKLGSALPTWLLQYPLSGLLISDRWAPKRLVARRKPVPLLVLHAVNDPVVPYSQGRRLFDLAPGPKEFWKLDSAGHTEALYARASQYRPPLLAWLDRVLE